MSDASTVTLLHHSPLLVCAKAIRKCWASEALSDNGGDKDRKLIDRVGNKNKHSSTLEHLVYSFDVDGFSRALLQEHMRHRIASPSVKSSRYTLKQLRDAPTITGSRAEVKQFCVLTGVDVVDNATTKALISLQAVLVAGVPNDKAKYAMPEAFRSSLVWTINARSLQNFLQLRSAKGALWEARYLADRVHAALPADHKYLFEEAICP